MTELYYSPTVRTPLVNFNSNGIFELAGISMPDNPYEFFTEILDWVKEYAQNPNPETFITIKLRYLNSSSSSMMVQFFLLLDEIQNIANTTINCNWYYEEEDTSMLDFVDIVKEYAPSIAITTTEIVSVFGISA